MDGMLSQDEINALLNGMDIDNAGTSGSDAADDMTSVGASDSASGNGGGSNEPDQSLLSDIEKDAIGEIANISMGTSATTLFSLVNQKVSITTPMVTIANWDTVLEEYPAPCVFIEIQYTEGLAGSNILILAERDVKIITDLMMGGDGTNIDGELGELHLSAISEAMNQMMGSSATSLSSMMGKKIDISPPKASLVKINEIIGEGKENNPFEENTFVKIAFRMQIGELVDSTIMQLYPLKFAKSLYEIFMGSQMDGSDSVEAAEAAAPAPAPMPMPAAMPAPSASPDPYAGYGAPAGAPMMPPPQQYAMPTMPQMNVQQAQFQAFTPDMAAIIGKENIGLIMDVPLEVTVELGRTQKSIHDILEFSPGTIIELEKIAGEPIDVLVNGKFVAKGEVVVIEESFGVRITEIIKDN